MSLFGVELNHQLNRITTEIRLNLQKHKFTPNLRTLYRSFAQGDPNISGLLPPTLFEKVRWLPRRHSTATACSSNKSIYKSSRKLSATAAAKSTGSNF